MQYVVFGAGAVGAYLGARLASSGFPVTFLARPRLAETFTRLGITLLGDTDPIHLPQPRVVTALEQLSKTDYPDAFLLTVKSYDTRAAGETIRTSPYASTPVISLANGIGNEETLARLIGRQRVIPASLTTAVRIRESGEVHVERRRGLGISGDHPHLPELQEDLKQAGIDTRTYRDGVQMKWSKMLVNIVSNATSAITGWSPEKIFHHAGLSRLEIEAMRETVRIMNRKNMRPQNLPGVPIALLQPGIFLPTWMLNAPLGRLVSRGRGGKKPSFYYDLERGRSEVAWLNGAIAREGQALRIPAPANQVLSETLEMLCGKPAQRARFVDRPETLLSLAQAAEVPGIRGYNPLGF